MFGLGVSNRGLDIAQFGIAVHHVIQSVAAAVRTFLRNVCYLIVRSQSELTVIRL